MAKTVVERLLLPTIVTVLKAAAVGRTRNNKSVTTRQNRKVSLVFVKRRRRVDKLRFTVVIINTVPNATTFEVSRLQKSSVS